MVDEINTKPLRSMDEREQRAFLKVISTIEERKARRSRRRIAFACSAVCGIALAFGLYLHFSVTPPVEVTETVFCCLEGESGTVTLPDLSTVRLVGNATLVHSSDFSAQNRKVHLKGEALFDITSDAEHPFEVFACNDCKVKVYGTQFNLYAPENAEEMTLTLLKGKVSFESPDVQCNVAPGEMIRYSSKTGDFKKSSINIDDYRLWMDGQATYGNITLKSLSDRLEGIYGVRIVLEKELCGLQKTFSISLKNREALPSVLEALEILLPISCELVDGVVYIRTEQTTTII